ncbi:MAG TPA: hypothetical protein VK176_09695 [Phycisphaerales bacterium]|nr:hypothetical protein [Phycisphaerales bacterium]
MSQGPWRLEHHDQDRGGSTAFGPVRIWPIAAHNAHALSIHLSGRGPAAWDARREQRWHEMQSANPRLHDGPIWSVHSFDPQHGIIAISPDSYSRYAVRPSVGAGVAMLAVRGMITAHDSRGCVHILMGQRSPQTRIYGDMWEVIPGGGVPRLEEDSPRLPAMHDLLVHLATEAREEAGLEVPLSACRVEAFCDDTYAGGFDVLIGVRLEGDLDAIKNAMGERDWEHRQLRWLAVDEIAAFDMAMAAMISPPTRAIFRYRGWAKDAG